MAQISLDKGILERLMSSDTATSQTDDAQGDQHRPEEVLVENITMPIVQVINIQNIATSAFLLKYNATTKSNISNNGPSGVRTNKLLSNTSTSRKTAGSTTSSNSLKRKCDNTSACTAGVGGESVEGGEQQLIEEEVRRSADRFLLILSDGEFYETRCLLLPNLNYLVSRTGF